MPKANCSVVAAAAAAGLVFESCPGLPMPAHACPCLPMPAERAPAAYRGLCMRAAPKRTRVQTVCKRAADEQHLLESASRPPSSMLPSLAQAACTRYALNVSFSRSAWHPAANRQLARDAPALPGTTAQWLIL
jgi:hypothetical protein